MSKKKLFLGVISLIIIGFIAFFINYNYIDKPGDSNTQQPTESPKPEDVLNNPNNSDGGDNNSANENGETGNSKTSEEHEEEHKPSAPTIYETTDNVQKVTGYNISMPEILQNAYSTTKFAKVVLANKGYIVVLDGNGYLNIYNPNTSEMTNLAKNVTKAVKNSDNTQVLFEVRTSNEYRSYQYDIENSSNGVEHILSTTSPVKSIGKIDDFIYFSNEENKNTLFYFPGPNASYAAEEVIFDQTKDFKSISRFREDNSFIAYSSIDNNVYRGSFGSEIKPVFSLPETEDKNLIFFEANPFNINTTQYIAGFSFSETLTSSTTTIIDGNISDDVTNVIKARWVNNNTLVYNDYSFDYSMWIYNSDSKKRFLIANQVMDFEYDAESKSIIYNTTTDDKIRKISIQ